MPKITYLKTFDGALWAKLELDMSTSEGSVHIFTKAEIDDLKASERRAVWAEIRAACMSNDDSSEDY